MRSSTWPVSPGWSPAWPPGSGPTSGPPWPTGCTSPTGCPGSPEPKRRWPPGWRRGHGGPPWPGPARRASPCPRPARGRRGPRPWRRPLPPRGNRPKPWPAGRRLREPWGERGDAGLEGIVVQKYGGSSVADAERIRRVARRVVATHQTGRPVVVVVSAMGDTTDHLIELAHQISPSPRKREMDMLLSTGEQVSIALLAMAIQEEGADAISLPGDQVGIRTDSQHMRARIQEVRTERILHELSQGRIVIVAGFQGIDDLNDISTVGRAGADTTAVALAAALKA